MKLFPSTLSFCLVIAAAAALGQTSGNIGYSQNGQNAGKAHAEQLERTERMLSAQELPPTPTSMFVDASVLMNVKADEYVAVFAVAQEGVTPEDAAQKMSAVLKQFTDALKTLRIRESDIFVDFITQPKIYTYDVTSNSARERLAGFELKKNVSIHFTDRDLIDKLVLAAASAQIYDLIKVDYVVKDINAVHEKLMTEASAIIKQKVADDERLLSIKVEPPAEIYAQRTAAHYPTDLYDSYAAAESESVSRPRNIDAYSIIQARKSRTFFFNGLDGNGFDKIVNPILLEPMVQFTLYLKLKYEVAR